MYFYMLYFTFILPCTVNTESIKTLKLFGHEYGRGTTFHGNYHHGSHGGSHHMEEGSGAEEIKQSVCQSTGVCPSKNRPNCCWLYHTNTHEDCCFCSNDAVDMDWGEMSDAISKYHVGGWCASSPFLDIFRHKEFECCTGGMACCVAPRRQYIDPHDHGFTHTETVKEFHNGHMLAIIIVCVCVLVIGIVTTCILRVKHKNAASRARRTTIRRQPAAGEGIDPPPYDHIMRSLSRTQSCQPKLKTSVTRALSDMK